MTAWETQKVVLTLHSKPNHPSLLSLPNQAVVRLHCPCRPYLRI